MTILAVVTFALFLALHPIVGIQIRGGRLALVWVLIGLRVGLLAAAMGAAIMALP